jgi:hypothetical protein
MAVPGDASCRAVADCGRGTWGDIAIEADTVFVDAAYAGADGDGSQSKPLGSLQGAIDQAPDGAIVAVAAGSYVGDLDIAGKQVRVWGRCPSLVEIVGVAAIGAVLISGSADGTELRGVAVRGPEYGVIVSGAEGVVLSHVWVHDTAERGIDAENTLGKTSLAVEDSLVERARDASIISLSAEITIARSVVRDAVPHASSGLARGLVLNVAQGSRVRTQATVTRSVVEHTRDNGVYVRGSDATVEGSVVRDILPNAADDNFGRGIAVEPGENVADRGSVVVRGSLVQRTHGEGVFCSACDATVETSVVREIEPEPDGSAGIGINAQDLDVAGLRSSVVVRQSLVADAYAIGIISLGSEVVVESSIVRDIHTAADGTGFGRGILLEPSELGNPCNGSAVRWSLVERVLDHGIMVGCDMPVEGSLVRDVAPNAVDGRFGRGIVVQSFSGPRPLMTLTGSLVERVHDVGIGVLRADGIVESTVVRDVYPRASDQLGGRGINVQLHLETQEASTLALRDTTVERSRDIGVAIIGGSATLDGLVVRDVAARGDGAFGDGVAAVQAQATITRAHVEMAARAGVISFGAAVTLSGSVLECNKIHLDREDLVVPGTFLDEGGNACGCAGETVVCQAVSSLLEAPAGLDPM